MCLVAKNHIPKSHTDWFLAEIINKITNNNQIVSLKRRRLFCLVNNAVFASKTRWGLMTNIGGACEIMIVGGWVL